jgi:hypothetical protein
VRDVLIIQCGASKRDEAAPIYDLYTHGLWASYRARRAELEGAPVSGPHPSLAVFVLSAEHGLVGEAMVCDPYDRIVVPDSFRGERKNGVPVRHVTDLAAMVQAKLLRSHSLRDVRRVWFAGGRLYREALELAGLEVTDLDPRGIGHKRGAIRRFLTAHAPLDLDALLAEVEGT